MMLKKTSQGILYGNAFLKIIKTLIKLYFSVLSLEILIGSDFDKVAGTAIYYLQYYHT